MNGFGQYGVLGQQVSLTGYRLQYDGLGASALASTRRVAPQTDAMGVPGILSPAFLTVARPVAADLSMGPASQLMSMMSELLTGLLSVVQTAFGGSSGSPSPVLPFGGNNASPFGNTGSQSMGNGFMSGLMEVLFGGSLGGLTTPGGRPNAVGGGGAHGGAPSMNHYNAGGMASPGGGAVANPPAPPINFNYGAVATPQGAPQPANYNAPAPQGNPTGGNVVGGGYQPVANGTLGYSHPDVYGGGMLTPQELDGLIIQAAQNNNIDPFLLKALVITESNGRPDAGSPAGAQGLAQLMPATARGLGVTNILDPQQNLNGGAKYLRSMLDRYDNNVSLALAAYNAGPGNVDKYGGIPPFAETQAHNQRTLDRYEQLRSEGAGSGGYQLDVQGEPLLDENGNLIPTGSPGELALVEPPEGFTEQITTNTTAQAPVDGEPLINNEGELTVAADSDGGQPEVTSTEGGAGSEPVNVAYDRGEGEASTTEAESEPEPESDPEPESEPSDA